MTTGVLQSATRQLFDSLFRPSYFVRADVDTVEGNWHQRIRYFSGLMGVYLLNLVLYAIPLTLAGFGTIGSTAAPAWFHTSVGSLLTNSLASWVFVLRLGENSLYLAVATALTFITYHAALVLTMSSKGLLLTLHTVIYSTSIYLAGVFSLVWYLATAPSVYVADVLVVNIQKQFVYYCIDLIGGNLELPGGRPGPINPALLTAHGKLVLAGLALLVGYYVYSMYLGARVNHHSSRFTALLTLGAILTAPVLFVVGSIFVATLT